MIDSIEKNSSMILNECFFLGTGGQSNFPHDIKTQSGVNQLYNQRVVSQERVTRPLGSSGGVFNSARFHHEGVL